MSGSGGTRWGTKIVLVVLAATCGAGAWYARGQQPAAGAQEEVQATATAAAYVEEDLATALARWTPGDDPAKLRHQLEARVLADSDVVAVRVFDPAGTLVFSTVTDDDATLDAEIASTVLEGARVDASDESTLRTYAPAGDLVGQIDQDAVQIRGAATVPWMIAQFGFLGVALVLLGAAMYAGNRVGPKERAPEKAEAPAKQAKREPDRSDPQDKKLLARAEKAEQSRRAMEDQLNVLRSQLQSGDAGSQARIVELEGHLRDAHARVTQAEEQGIRAAQRIADLEIAVDGEAPTQKRSAALETEVATSRVRIRELETLLKSLEARAVQAETTTAAHTGQLGEAHAKAQQAEVKIQEYLDRAVAAERQLEELRARLATSPAPGSTEDGALVRQLQEELAALTTAAADRDRALRDALGRADSAEQLLSASQARLAAAEARIAGSDRAAGASPPTAAATDTKDHEVRELEIALADARAAAWAATAEVEPDGPSLGVVETHAVPEDEEDDGDEDGHTPSGVEPQLDEAAAIRAELARMGQIVEHAGEAGDVDGLRDRLAKTAARKKGRSVGDDRIVRSS